jgi:hypothetical protein
VIVDLRSGPGGMAESSLFYSADGLKQGELLAPNAGKVHAAGRYDAGLSFPLVFQTYDPQSQRGDLLVSTVSAGTEPGVLVPLANRSMLGGLAGVPAEPTVFYTVFQVVDSVFQTQFYLGALDALATAAPVLTLESNESRFWKPVAIQMKDGAPQGLWFTRMPMGIGGEIVFTYNEGLEYFDMASGQVLEVLPADSTFSSLSPDQTWVAYSARQEGRPQYFIKNLAGGAPFALPLLPESDRGGGDGVFSPLNQHLAWREVRGSLFDGTFQQTIRVAGLDGQVVREVADSEIYAAANISAGSGIRPVGWLDEQTCLVQVVETAKPHNGKLVKLNMATGELSLFADGYFSGWLYP